MRILNATLPEVAAVFSDRSETQTLECTGVRVDGYTRLVALVPEPDARKSKPQAPVPGVEVAAK